MDRQRFSSEGVHLSDSTTLPPSQADPDGSEQLLGSKNGSLKRGVAPGPKFSHFASIESAEVLKAATADLVRVFQLQVHKKILLPAQMHMIYRYSTLCTYSKRAACILEAPVWLLWYCTLFKVLVDDATESDL